MLLNNAPVAIASTGQDNASQNREVDLDMFPSELFSQLSVHKTPSADIIEGGAAGTINMRMARPFDNEGSASHLLRSRASTTADAEDNGAARLAGRAAGPGEKFGVLVGVAGVKNKVATGF